MTRPQSRGWLTRTPEGDGWTTRTATARERWLVAYNPLTGAWYARPRAIGVWATREAALIYFPTLVAAGDYARERTTQR